MKLNTLITIICIASFSLPALAYEKKHEEHEAPHTNLSDAAIEKREINVGNSERSKHSSKANNFRCNSPQ